MHIRVYGVQPDELPVYREAESRCGFTFEFASGVLNEGTVEEVSPCDAVIVLTNSSVNRTVAARLAEKGVRYVAARSAGSDHIDVRAARACGLHCCCVPRYAPEAISEHTILLALSVLRHAKLSAKKVAAGDFTMQNLKGRQLGQMTAGVFGTGRIGRTTMALLRGFGAEVLGWDPYPSAEAEKLCTYVEPEELLRRSDIVFLHCPLTEESRHMIGEEAIGKMKDGAVLVNTARGALVDHQAVLEALERGKLSGFAFDVYENESAFIRKQVPWDSIGDPVFRTLCQRDDTVYSPHVAFYTDAAIRSMIEVTLENLKEYETCGTCRNEILPEGESA